MTRDVIFLVAILVNVCVGYLIGRVHAWFLELLWRDAAGRRLRAVARCGVTSQTEAAIADTLEMSAEADYGR